jgi:hypothetical protein
MRQSIAPSESNVRARTIKTKSRSSSIEASCRSVFMVSRGTGALESGSIEDNGGTDIRDPKGADV